ncbi:MAG TPA: hypothetical protein VFI23_05915 [Rhizomicrobium sp.]|nr:hypothetical protein [Rhizomicrobium sp.]
MDHDFYWFFPRFWWLIFPLFWMICALAWGWSRHSRANRALDIIKSYADQGKDPPPELVKSLQAGMEGGCGRYGWRHSPERRLHRAILFTVLAIAFGAMSFWHMDDGDRWHHHPFGLFVPMIIFAALAFSNFLSLLFMSRGWPPDDKDKR